MGPGKYGPHQHRNRGQNVKKRQGADHIVAVIKYIGANQPTIINQTLITQLRHLRRPRGTPSVKIRGHAVTRACSKVQSGILA